MKTILLSLMLILTQLTLSASSPKKVLKKFEESFKQISPNVYVDHTETTNGEYNWFLRQLKKENKEELYQACKLDSNQWVKKFVYAFNEPWTEKYHWHPGFNKYPVVNITKAGAEEYCMALARLYNKQEDRKFHKVIFRLPTEHEWMKASSPLPGHVLPWYGLLPYTAASLKKEGASRFLTNIKVYSHDIKANRYALDGGNTTMAIGSFAANEVGIYDIIGNVAELTQDGIIKGGSWDNYIEECHINKSQNYEIPDPRVGFRVVMEVIEE